MRIPTLLILFIFVPILSLILLLVNVLLSPSKPDESKVSPYECGMPIIPNQTRLTFHIHFYVVAILFLIFDLEVLLLYPLAASLYHVNLYGFCIALLFLLVLTIGFILEIGSGAISLRANKTFSHHSSDSTWSVSPLPFGQKRESLGLKRDLAPLFIAPIYLNRLQKAFLFKKLGEQVLTGKIKLFKPLVLLTGLAQPNLTLSQSYPLFAGCFVVLLVAYNSSDLTFVSSIVFPLLPSGFKDDIFKEEGVVYKDIVASSNIPFPAPSSYINNQNQTVLVAPQGNIYVAQSKLKEMYKTLNGYEKEFADKYLTHLLEVRNDTGLNVNYMESAAIINRKETYVIKSAKDCQNIGNKYHNAIVVYSFSTTDFDMSKTYIGLTQNLTNRLEAHYMTYSRVHRHYGLFYPFCLEIGGMSKLLLNVHLTMPTYQSLFEKKFGVGKSDNWDEYEYILQAFSEFQAGIYEQAFFSFYKPGLNENLVTQFNFLNWRPGFHKRLLNKSYFADKKLALANKFVEATPSPSYLYGQVAEQDVTINSSYLYNLNRADQFDFSLYYELCQNRGLPKIDKKWLEWFVGFMERRATYHPRYHTNSLKLGMTNLNFLLYIQKVLNLKSSPFYRKKVGFQLVIGSVADLDILFSILFPNIVTASFQGVFIETFNKKYGNMIALTLDSASSTSKHVRPKMALDNGWLSGFIDANSSFSFTKETYPIITITLTNNREALLLIKELFPLTKIIRNGKALAFTSDKAVTPLLCYLGNYPLKFQHDIGAWFISCMEIRYQNALSRVKSTPALKDLISKRPKD